MRCPPEELTVDPGRSPERIGERHLEDQVLELRADRGTPWPLAPRLPGPEKPEALAMPADDGLWANQAQGVAPRWPAAGEPDPEEAVHRPKLRSLGAMPQESQLLPECEVLER